MARPTLALRPPTRWRPAPSAAAHVVLALVVATLVATCGSGPSPSGATGTGDASGGPSAATGLASRAPTPSPDPQIDLGSMTTFDGALPSAGVDIHNPTTHVKTFTLKASWRKGDAVIATAVAAVNDLRPDESRAVLLIIDGTTKGATQTDLVVEKMLIDAPSTRGSEIATKLEVGKPLPSLGALPTIKVAVTNHGDVPHSLSLAAGIYRGGKLVGMASGAVNDVAAGSVKSADLLVTGSLKKGDTVHVWVDTIFE
jgi:hypothetical protein